MTTRKLIVKASAFALGTLGILLSGSAIFFARR